MKKLLSAFFLILALTGCKSEKNIETKTEVKKDVKIQELKVQNIKTTKIYNGSIKPSNEITIITPTGGYV
ncbi:MAG: lipoprotein, partial [Cetobacterium sp.]